MQSLDITSQVAREGSSDYVTERHVLSQYLSDKLATAFSVAIPAAERPHPRPSPTRGAKTARQRLARARGKSEIEYGSLLRRLPYSISAGILTTKADQSDDRQMMLTNSRTLI